MIIYRIYNPYSITVEYRDEYGELFTEVPAGAAVEEKPYSESEALHALRSVRTAKLAETDYTQLPDVTLSTGTIEEWLAYRQQLRDITDGLQWNVTVWPDRPQ